MNYKQYENLGGAVPRYAQIADEVLTHWKNTNTFEESVRIREGSPTFTFYEGPPSANGTPGIHHVMARSIKDIFCRYKTLRGFQVKRKGGWDTHGLPIELQVEKELGITKEDIGKSISVEEYNRKCRETVMRFTDQWNNLTEKMGYWVDLNDPYVTYENNYIESLWSLLKRLYDKDLLYKGYTIQPYSPKAGTGLSSHELNMPGTYKDVKDTTIVAMFKAKTKGRPGGKAAFLADAADSDDIYILAWTTTPWTLPANSALTVGKDIDYVLIKTFNPYTHDLVNVVLAKALVGRWFNEKGKVENVNDLAFGTYQPGDNRGAVIPWAIIDIPGMKGAHLEGIEYEQLMPYPATAVFGDKSAYGEKAAFRVILGDFVTTEDGTGVVHTSPTFGADDFRVAQANGIPAIMVRDENGKEVPIVDKQGRFVSEITDYAGRYVKEEYYSDEERADPEFRPTDVLIAIKLKEEGKAFRVEKYEHPYPHCWRTDKPVLYYPLDSWFIRTTAVKDKLVALNKTINWHPESTGTGRFGNWLENLVDWNLSRSRFWGTPLPIWTCGYGVNQNDTKCVGSIEELKGPGWYYFGGPKFELFKELVHSVLQNESNKTQEQEQFYYDIFTPFSQEVKGLVAANFDLRNLEANTFSKAFFEKLAPYLLTTNEFLEAEGVDLHRPYVDRIIFLEERITPFTSSEFEGIKDDVHYLIFTREPDLIDVWFDSGAMPYAQWHYPFENKEIFDQSFPADFISEGVDQTRGWFFTLHAIAGMLGTLDGETESSVAFKNVVSTGLVLDKNGNKMSKRLGNAVDPFETLATYGADPTRWYMITNAEPWENLKFNLDGIVEVQRKFFGTLVNTYNFFALYANLDNYRTEQFNRVPYEQLTELDRWILSKLMTLVKEVTEQFEDYNPTKAGRLIQDFVCDQLSNWYVRLSRRRFWSTGVVGEGEGGELPLDKRAAYETLQHCLTAVAQLMSPIAPFFADWLYHNLTDCVREESTEQNTPFQYDSVHFTNWHPVEEAWIDTDLETSMELAQNICSLVHSLRKGHKIKVRQPLTKVLIPVLNAETRRQIEHVTPIIESEVNVRAVEFIDGTSAESTAGILKKKIKPNFKALGPKFGKQMKEVAARITAMTSEEISQLEQTGSFVIATLNQAITLADTEILTEDVPGWLVASEGGLTVALDVTITDDLRREGIARDFVNRIQNLRKDSNFDVTDKIKIMLERNNEELAQAVETNKAYICQEVQALSLELVDELNGRSTAEIEMDDFLLRVAVAKA